MLASIHRQQRVGKTIGGVNAATVAGSKYLDECGGAPSRRPRREKRQKIGRKKLSHLLQSDDIKKEKTRVFRGDFCEPSLDIVAVGRSRRF